VTGLEEMLRHWRAQDEILDRVEETWWGAVVTDPRFPRINEANYARVEALQPVSLDEVNAALLPALERARSPIRHVVVFHADEQTALLAEASTGGARLGWDLVMRHEGPPPQADPRAEPVGRFDRRFWAAHRASLDVFGATDEEVVEQMVAFERDVGIPAGRTWFAVREQREIVALGSLLILARVGVVDGVATLPHARRRGYAAAIVTRALVEASTRGARAVHLLADPRGDAERIYRRLGFEPLGQIASWLS
jgi:GNAT superfamily N-acetyltransferase